MREREGILYANSLGDLGFRVLKRVFRKFTGA